MPPAPVLRCVTFQTRSLIRLLLLPTILLAYEQVFEFCFQMNSSYGSFDFTGGWQDDRFVGPTSPVVGHFPNLHDGRFDDAGNQQEVHSIYSPDEWLNVQSAWLQQSDPHFASTPLDINGYNASPTYAIAQGHSYDADLANLSDFYQCPTTSSSFSETDLDYFQPNFTNTTNHRTDSFSSLPLSSPTSDPSYQRATTSNFIQPYSPSSIPYNNNHPTSHTNQTHQAHLTNAPPSQDLLPSDPLHPRHQLSRFDGDLYTPSYVRGDGPTRAGWCSLCSSWLTLKDSAYWYHMHFAHGISCATGRYLPGPIRFRAIAGAARGVGDAEALCGGCGRWVLIVTGEKGRTAWWRHAYRCKFKDGGDGGKERKRGKSSSPRKVVARPSVGAR